MKSLCERLRATSPMVIEGDDQLVTVPHLINPDGPEAADWIERRHGQARWVAMNVLAAGRSLPSRRKWAGLYRLAADFLKLLETDREALR